MAKKLEVIWSRRAFRDLESICDYLEEEFSAGVANDVLRQILWRIDRLSLYPEIGRPDPVLSHLGLGHRYFTEKKYSRIVYRIMPDHIRVTNIFHTRMSEETMLALASE